jgi:ABC-2 type transport system permease protein
MRAYTTLLRVSTRRMLAYRANSFFNWLGGATFLAASLAVWHALLADRTIGGYDWDTMKAYLLIGWATGAIGSAYGDWWMADRILEGGVAMDLVRPVDYQWARFAEHMGGLVMEVIAIAVATLSVVLLADGVPLPASPARAGLFLLSFLLVIPLKFAITYLTTMLCFWTYNFMGLSWAKDAVVRLLSGGLVPLVLLPGWLATAAALLPFAGITATPAAIYLGQADGTAALRLIAVQAAWVVGLWLIARLLWPRALRTLTIHGG